MSTTATPAQNSTWGAAGAVEQPARRRARSRTLISPLYEKLALEVLGDDAVGRGRDLGEHDADLLGARVVDPLVDVGDAPLDFEDDVLLDRQDEVERLGLLEPLGVLGEQAERVDRALLVAGADVAPDEFERQPLLGDVVDA